MSEEIVTLGIKVDTSGVQRGADDLDKLAGAGKRAEKSTDGVSDGFRTMATAIAGLGLGATVREFIQAADAMDSMSARLKLVTTSSREAVDVQSKLVDLANANRAGLQETVSLFTKIADPVKRAGGSMADSLKIVDSFAKTLKISGASAQEAAAATYQFAQAMASGKLAGDEFRSLAEASPRFMNAMAEGMNVPREALKKLAEDGKLTIDVVGNAMMKMQSQLTTEFAVLPTTVADAMTQIKNEVLVGVQEINTAGGFTQSIVSGLDEVNSAMPSFKATLLEAAKGFEGLEQQTSFVEVGLTTLRYTMETLLVVGGNLAYMAQTAGRELGGMAAQMAALGRGDIAAFSAIGEAMREDAKTAKKALDDYEKRVMGAYATQEALRNDATNSRADMYKKWLRQDAEFAAQSLQIIGAYAGQSVEVQQAAMAEYVKNAYATSATGGLKPPSGGVDLGKVKKEIEELAKLLDRINGKDVGLDSGYWKDLNTLHAAYAKGKLSLDAYAKTVGNLTDQQQFAKDMIAEETKAINEHDKALEDYLRTEKQRGKSLSDTTDKLNDELATLGMGSVELAKYAAAKLDAATAGEIMAAQGLEEAASNLDALNYLPEVAQQYRELAAAKRLAAGELNEQSLAGVQIAAKKVAIDAAKDSAKEWERFSADIERSLTDALMRSFESGESFGDAFIKNLKNTFKTAALKLVIQTVTGTSGSLVNSAINWAAGTSGNDGGKGTDYLGLANNASTGYNSASTAYGLYTQGWGATAGNALSTVGSYVGSAALQSYGAGYSAGLSGVSDAIAAYNLAAADAVAAGNASQALVYSNTASSLAAGGTAPGAGAGGAGSSTGVMGTVAWVAAIAAGMYMSSEAWKAGERWDGKYSPENNLLEAGPSGIIHESQYDVTKTLFGNDFANSQAYAILSGNALSQQVHNWVWGGKAEYTNTGMTGGFSDAGGFSGSEYAKTHYEGGWFKKDYDKTDWAAISGEFDNFFDSLYQGVKNTYLLAGQVFEDNTFVDKIKSFAMDIGDVNTADMSGALKGIGTSLTEAVGSFLLPSVATVKTQSIDLANSLKTSLEQATASGDTTGAEALKTKITQLEAVGAETWTQTFGRMMQETQAVAGVLDLFGTTLVETFGKNNMDGILKMSDNLVNLFGGIDAMNTSVNAYYGNFYSESEKTARSWEMMGKSFEALNLTMPTTRDGFKDIVDGLDLNTLAGQATFKSLMDLQGGFATLVPVLDAASDSAAVLATRLSWQQKIDVLTGNTTERKLALEADLASTTDDATKTLVRQVYAMEDQKTAADAAAEAIKSTTTALQSLAQSNSGYEDVYGTPASKQAALGKQIKASLGTLGLLMPTSEADYTSLVESYRQAEGVQTGRLSDLGTLNTLFGNWVSTYWKDGNVTDTDTNKDGVGDNGVAWVTLAEKLGLNPKGWATATDGYNAIAGETTNINNGFGRYSTLLDLADEIHTYFNPTADDTSTTTTSTTDLATAIATALGQQRTIGYLGMDQDSIAQAEIKRMQGDITASFSTAVKDVDLGSLLDVQALAAGIDTTTTSGQSLLAALAELAPALNTVAESAAAAQKAAEEKAAADLKAATELRQSWQDRLDVLTGKTTERALQLQRDLASTTDATTQSIIRQVYAQEDLRTALDAALETAKDDAANAYAALERAVEAEKKLAQASLEAAQEQVSSLTSIFDALKSGIDTLYGSVESTAGMQAAQGVAFISEALATALSSGYMPDPEDLSDAISAAMKGTEDTIYASQIDADRAKLVLAGEMSQLKDVAGKQKTVAETALELAQGQLDALDDTLAEQKKLYDAALGIDTSVKSVATAIAGLSTALSTLNSATRNAATVPSSTPVYSTQGAYTSSTQATSYGGLTTNFIGTAGEAIRLTLPGKPNAPILDVGANWSTSQITNQVLSNIKAYGSDSSAAGAIATWAATSNLVDKAALKAAGIPGFAIGTSYVPEDMTANIHKGEIIIDPASSNVLRKYGINVQGQGNEALVAEVKALREEVIALRRQTDTANQHAKRTADATNGRPEAPVLVEIV